MMWKLVILCLAIPACMSQHTDEIVLSLDISLSHAHVGDDVVLFCTVYDMPADGFIYWFKKMMTQVGEVMEGVAISTTAMPPYDRFSRFQFDKSSSGTTKSYTMTINGVQTDDTGHWGCSYREEIDNIYEAEMLVVYDDIDNITLQVNNTLMSTEAIMTLADEPLSLVVNVSRSNPSPVIQMYLDDREITGELAHVSHTHVMCAVKDPNKNCSISYLMSTRAFGRYNFSAHDDLKVLTICTHVPGSGFEHINRSYPLILDHAPLFLILTNQLARRGANFTVTTKVNARPTAADFIYWRMTKDGQDTFVFPGIYSEDWNAFVTVGIVDDTTCEVSLTLYLISDYHYGDYELFAGNEHGNKSVVMTLIEDFSPPVGPSSANVVSSNIMMLIVLMSVFLWMRYD